ncbi:MAG: hypothetical protein ACK6DC_07810 [Planctomycetota bacterium]
MAKQPARTSLEKSFNILRMWMMCCGLASLFAGCQQWPGTQAMKQYQLESDRLLSEFRSQKKRAEELEQRNQQLEKRLGESERMISNLQCRPSSRAADRSKERMLTDLGTSPSSSPTKRLSGSGLPDATPPTPGRFTSGSYNGGADLKGDPSRSNQWRPVSRP